MLRALAFMAVLQLCTMALDIPATPLLSCSRLQYLDVSYNALTGTLPAQWGQVPAALGESQAAAWEGWPLRSLFLADNHLVGMLPGGAWGAAFPKLQVTGVWARGWRACTSSLPAIWPADSVCMQ